ncbi:MAG: hypothetical protein ACRD8A_14615 [Candidatus Acidiferrales bacterium]
MKSAATQEENRKYMQLANVLDQARDWLTRVTGQLTAARKAKKAVQTLELESAFSQASEAFGKAAAEYEAFTGVPAPLSTGPQLKPGTVAALRASSEEFRRLDDEVAGCEHAMNRLHPQIVALEQVIAAQVAIPVFGSADESAAAEAVLDSIYPERVGLRADNVGRIQFLRTKTVHLQRQRADLKSQLETVTARWNAVRATRDKMFAQFEAGR